MAQIFPFEILSGIASYLKRPDLLNLSLTCRDLRDIAVPYIWEHLEVTDRWQRRQQDADMKWSPGDTAPAATHLRHVKRFDIRGVHPDYMSSAELSKFGQTLKLCFENMTNVEEINTSSFCAFNYWDAMDPSILADLAAIRSLTRLRLRFPEPDLFRTSSYEEILGHLEHLGNLTYLKCSIHVEHGPREALALARILANCPTLRYLEVRPYLEDDEPSDERWDDTRRLFSIVCLQYSNIRSRSIQASETARLCGDWETYRRLSIIPLLSLEKLTLDNTIVCPEMHQLMDTQSLEHLSISTSGWTIERENPYDGTQGAFQMLAGRASKLSSVSFEGPFDQATAGHGLDLSKDFPALSELTVLRMDFAQWFVEQMTNSGGAGANAKMWKKLTLDWPDGSLDSMDVDDMITPLLEFLTDCVNLTYLRTHVYWETWDRFVTIVSQLSQLSELHVTIEYPTTRQITTTEPAHRMNADAVTELFNCNPALNIAWVDTNERDAGESSLWGRFHDGLRPVTSGEENNVNFSPGRNL